MAVACCDDGPIVMTVDTRALSGLLQLASPSLPVGAFSHSLGLEAALDAGLVTDAASAERFIGDMLEGPWLHGDAPLWRALFFVWEQPDVTAITIHNHWLIVSRETAELRRENEQTGRSLVHWLLALPGHEALTAAQRDVLDALSPPAFVTVHALAARLLGLDAKLGLHALGYALIENLVMAALKAVPLGQDAGQAMQRRLALRLPQWLDRAEAIEVDAATNFAPMLAILSARHETQYSRLFRS